MSKQQPIDYDALAKQNGAISSTTPASVDYDALAKQHGAVSSTAPGPNPNQAILDAQKAKYPTQAESGKPVQPDRLQGFLSEAAKNARNLGGALLNAAPQVPGQPPVDSGMDTPEMKLLAATVPGEGQFQGLSDLPRVLGDSPAAQLVKGVGQLGKRGLQGLGLLNSDVPVAQQIEQKIAATGVAGKRIAMKVAPQLADDFGLAVSKPGPAFDQALFHRYEAAGKAVRDVEAAIPDATVVDKQSILDGFDDLIKRYHDVGAEDAVAALTRQKNILTNLPAKPPVPVASGLLDEYGKAIPAPSAAPEENLTWDQFAGIKQRLGNDLKKTGVWRRLLSDNGTEKDAALAQAYGHFMQASSGVSEDLAKANQTFSTLHDAVTAAGLDLTTGRRIASVGKLPPPSILRKALPVAAKGAVGALGVEGAYKVYKSIEP